MTLFGSSLIENDPTRFRSQEQVGYEQVGYEQVGYEQVGYEQVGYEQVGYEQVGYEQVGYEQVGYEQVGYEQVGYEQVGYEQVGYEQVGYEQVGYEQVGDNLLPDLAGRTAKSFGTETHEDRFAKVWQMRLADPERITEISRGLRRNDDSPGMTVPPTVHPVRGDRRAGPPWRSRQVSSIERPPIDCRDLLEAKIW